MKNTETKSRFLTILQHSSSIRFSSLSPELLSQLYTVCACLTRVQQVSSLVPDLWVGPSCLAGVLLCSDSPEEMSSHQPLQSAWSLSLPSEFPCFPTLERENPIIRIYMYQLLPQSLPLPREQTQVIAFVIHELFPFSSQKVLYKDFIKTYMGWRAEH